MNNENNHKILSSVLLPVYNGSKYLREAIESLLQQTFKDFELIIIDDCSKDNSLEIIKSFVDNRIIIFENPKNKGKSYSLNKGIEAARGKYLILADQDDISFPSRFQKQIDFMEANPEIGVSGTQIETFGENVISETSNYPLTHQENILRLLTVSPFAHPSVILRKKVLISNNLRYIVGVIAEDYSLWTRLLLVAKSANLKEVLLRYRIHPASITKTYIKKPRRERKKFRILYAKETFDFKYSFWPRILNSGIPLFRKVAIKYIVHLNKGNKRVKKHLIFFDNYFSERDLWKYYFNRLLNLLLPVFKK